MTKSCPSEFSRAGFSCAHRSRPGLCTRRVSVQRSSTSPAPGAARAASLTGDTNCTARTTSTRASSVTSSALGAGTVLRAGMPTALKTCGCRSQAGVSSPAGTSLGRRFWAPCPARLRTAFHLVCRSQGILHRLYFLNVLVLCINAFRKRIEAPGCFGHTQDVFHTRVLRDFLPSSCADRVAMSASATSLPRSRTPQEVSPPRGPRTGWRSRAPPRRGGQNERS